MSYRSSYSSSSYPAGANSFSSRYSSSSSYRSSLDYSYRPSSYTSYRRDSYYPSSSSYTSEYLRPFERPSMYERHRRFKPNSYRPIIDVKPWTPSLPQTRDQMVFDLLSDENRKKHHTEKYGVRTLVVRRGDSFVMLLKFPLVGKDSLEELKLTISTGSNPKENKGTCQTLILTPEDTKPAGSLGGWTAAISDVKKGSVKVAITPPTNAVVGGYDVKASAKVRNENDNEDVINGELRTPIYVLFNAWCKDDDVFIKDDKERNEYVMNESGRVYRGIVGNRPQGVPWTFGQFAKACLEGAIYLLDKSSISKHLHGNPVMVVRALSAMVNCNDDDGVLWGRWDGSYSDGKSPTEWVSSISIMENYMRYKKSVKYGQCWVFSALCVSVCRALGIPCRSVTNFDSAHDTDGSMTIDRHFDPHGNSLSDKVGDDSVWNFHVWNEAWLKRPDLPEGYNGWQAFDATPQEESEGRMRCGPAPLKAIKDGEVYLNYDAKFIFAEVNGDRLVWICDLNANTMVPVKSQMETNSVGNFISTKAVGSNDRMDITHLYKHKEGSEEERRAVEKACRFACVDKKKALSSVVYSSKEDVQFETVEGCDGGDLYVEVTIKNQSEATRTGFVRIVATASYYTGIAAETLDSKKYDFTLAPGKEKVGKWQLMAKKYMNVIDEDADAKVMIVGFVEETKQYFTREHTFTLDKEDIVLQVTNPKPQVGQNFDVTLSLKNMTKVDLTNGVIHIEGPGIQKDFEYRIRQPIKSYETFQETFKMSPKYPGKREIVASFKSKQICGITGSIEVEVM